MSNETSINSEIMREGVTAVNDAIISESKNEDSNSTAINSEIMNASNLNAGDVLCENYVVLEKMDVSTGEADLYICENGGKKYVAKVYRRKAAVKDEVVDKLTKIDSERVARVCAASEWNGFPVVIIPYYKNGSLQGKKYTYIELKKHIIPSLNEGIKVLHDNGIVHKDLKPSNIMLNDNGIDVSIIDFGISSVRDANNTIIVTQTGMTPQYSAPETFNNLFLSESDYYSFGITIYELFCGHAPYSGLPQDEIEKYISIQKIPLPEDMPEDLQKLVIGLTYRDIANRKDKTNPNRRWGYEEVCKWCQGVEMVIPGESAGTTIGEGKIPPYAFKGQSYDTKSSLVQAFAHNWDDGKKQLFRGLLSGFFKGVNPEIAGFCLDAEEEAANGSRNEDIIFFSTLYKIDDSLTKIFWKGEEFETLEDLGKRLLNKLWSNSNDIEEIYGEALNCKMLTSYAESIGLTDEKTLQSLRGIETTYKTLGNTSGNKTRVYYLMAYMLSGDKVLFMDGEKFDSIDALSRHLEELLKESYDSFDGFCKKLINEMGNLDPQFESWLIALGKQEEIEKWRSSLK